MSARIENLNFQSKNHIGRRMIWGGVCATTDDSKRVLELLVWEKPGLIYTPLFMEDKSEEGTNYNRISYKNIIIKYKIDWTKQTKVEHMTSGAKVTQHFKPIKPQTLCD